jgi:S-adenosylmethionine decarboxylase
MHSGREWVVDAYGCDPAALADPGRLERAFAGIVEALGLHPVAPAQWRQFPGPGGITGMVMLAESHLTVHTFPEHGALCLNLFCCRPRPATQLERFLAGFAPRQVRVRRLDRPFTRASGGRAIA